MGSLYFTPYALPLIASGLIATWLGVYALRRWMSAPGAASFVQLMALVAVWSLSYAAEISATTLSLIVFIHQLSFFAIVFLPVAWLRFGLGIGMPRPIPRDVQLALLVVPLIVLVGVWTNAMSRLMWLAPTLDTSGTFPALDPGGHGWLFWVHTGYSYVLLLIGTVGLASGLMRQRHLTRWQCALMLLSVLTPWLANAAGLFEWGPVPQIDFTPVALLVTGLTAGWGLFSLRLLDIVPIAHDAIFEGMADAALVLDLDGRVLEFNPAAEALLAAEGGAIVGTHLANIASATPTNSVLSNVVQLMEDVGDGPRQFEVMPDGDPDQRSFDVQVVPLKHGRAGTLLMLRDTTARRRLLIEDADRRSEARYRALVQLSSDMIAVLDGDGTIQYHSPAIEQILGHASDAFIGKNVVSLLHPDDGLRAVTRLRDLDRHNGTQLSEFRVRHRDGTWRLFETIATNHMDDPAVGGIVINLRDITQRKELEGQLAHQALHDPLTGLPNRALFLDRLEQALAARPRHGGMVVVVYIDLDNFKLINDSLGHAAGDDLLKMVAARLRAAVRAEDTAARLGGDEFTLLLVNIADRHDALRVVEELQHDLGIPILLGGRSVAISGSCGIAFAEPADMPGDVLRKADLAMYDAKARGRGRSCLFDPIMAAAARDQLDLEADLPQALENHELQLHYQPMIDLASGEVCEVEALLRWHHPRRGLLLPGEFISLAESSGLIVPIGRWVLDEACRQLAAWRASGSWLSDVCLNVNLSPRQFQDPELVRVVSTVLERHGIAPEHLRLEITESLAMENVELTISVLWMLKSVGVQLAVDDFGTGHSSLSYLARFPVDTLKVDRSFVEAVAFDPQIDRLVRALVAFARTLGLNTVAEGIETEEQMCALRAMGCDLGQGFLFSRPVPPRVLAAQSGYWRPLAAAS
jgi:diguanylate cyclase (GGDEF)-like protein/PAS domain S-box-containing protein